MGQSDFEKNILCIGAGYVGGPTMAMVALKCPNYRVTCVDINPARVAAWNSEELPIFEPGLDSIIAQTRGKNLFFSTDIEPEIARADIIFVSVNTPTKTYGEGAGMAADLKYWEKTARQILCCSAAPKIIVEKSTVPVRTAQAMERILGSSGAGVRHEVLSNPEFLAEGTAMRDLEFPDRVLIGSKETESGLRAREELVNLYARWVPRERIFCTNTWSSELSKLVANAFLAQRISSINSISALCEKTGADVEDVARAVGMDKRIGPYFLRASVGFGGHCFKKDILNLVYLCRTQGLDEVADYWESVVRINEFQKERMIITMLRSMFDTLAEKRICLLGFAFKANTGDTRESPAIHVARRLVEERASLVVTDPRALDNAKLDLEDLGDKVIYEEDAFKAAEGCDALAVLTEWPLYKDLDYETIYKAMSKPAFIFDGRNLLDHKRLHGIGYNVYATGKTPLTHY
jgi:UDPglucose 6-dehydrogenase